MGWVIGPECAVLLGNRLHHSWYFLCSSGDGNWHYSVILLHRCRGAQRQCHVCSPFAHRHSELPCPLPRGSWGSTCLEETAESCQQKITVLRKFWSYLSNLLCLETDLVVVFILLYTSSWVLYFLSSKKWSGYFKGVRVANGQLQNLGVLGRNSLHICDSIREWQDIVIWYFTIVESGTFSSFLVETIIFSSFFKLSACFFFGWFNIFRDDVWVLSFCSII